MLIKDYKSKHTYTTLGLKRGKAAIRRETSRITPRRVFVWLGLFALVVFVNYLFFVRLGPINKKEINIDPTQEKHKKSNTFAQWFTAGYKRHQEGDLMGAAEAYTKAIILKPEEPRSYFNRGIVYIKMGEHDKAIDDCNKVIALDPGYAEAYNNRGWAYFQKGLFDRAIQDCNQALLLDPDMATAYHTRGMAYKAKGLFDMAKNDFQKSCKLGDSNSCKAYGEVSRAMSNRK
jgi:tetratricopeptide (TPR) repeat protein